MAEPESFHVFFSELRRGNPDACKRLLRQYTIRLSSLARANLDERIRGRLDPEDIIQSVFRSFFRRLNQGELNIDFGEWNGLWSLLAQMTILKCRAQVEFHRAQKRDVRREVVATSVIADDADELADNWEPICPEPTPQETAAVVDMIESILRGLPTDQHRQALAMRLEGLGSNEIARTLGVTVRSVQRSLKLIRDELTHLIEESKGGKTGVANDD